MKLLPVLFEFLVAMNHKLQSRGAFFHVQFFSTNEERMRDKQLTVCM